MYSLFGGIDYHLIHRDPFFFYPGIDFLGGGIDMNYEIYSKDPMVEEHGVFIGGQFFGGFRLRAGFKYMVNNHSGVFLEITRSMYFLDEVGFFAHNDIGIGFHYIF